jgi:hypothetical protein
MAARTLADKLVQGDITPGVYRLDTDVRPIPLVDALQAQGWRVFVIDGTMVKDKVAFLRVAGEAMAFPAYAGANWDAFEELINDLSWAPAPGYAILYDGVRPFAEAQPRAWRTARDILQASAAEWQRRDIPLVVLLRKSWYTNRDLPLLGGPRTGAKR